MKKGILPLFWVLGLMFITLTAFAIFKPFIWYAIFCKPPPENITTFSSLLTILIALLALGIGIFGAVTYYAVSQRIHEEIKKAAEQEYLTTVIRINADMCLLYGSLYEILMLTLELKGEDWLDNFINLSVHYGTRAITLTQALDEKTNKELILKAKNNYALALALRGDQGTAKTAEEIINYLEVEIKGYPENIRPALEETINFLRWRVPRKPGDCEKAIKNLLKILESSFYKDTLRRNFIEKRWEKFSKPEDFT